MIKCPRCQAAIFPLLWQREFVCAQCRTQLRLEWIGPLLVFLLAWLLISLAAIQLLEAAAPAQQAVPVLLSALLIAVIGWGLFTTVFLKLCQLRIRSRDQGV